MTEAEKFWKMRAMAAERAIAGHQIAAKELKGRIRLLTAERDILARQLRELKPCAKCNGTKVTQDGDLCPKCRPAVKEIKG